MATTFAEPQELMENIYSWGRGEDGQFSVGKFVSISGDFKIVRVFQPAELDELHPMLPPSLTALINWHHETHAETKVLGHRVSSLLRLLTDDVVYFRDANDAEHVFQHIYDYTLDPVRPDTVDIFGMQQTIATRLVDGVAAPFVTSVDLGGC